MSRHSGGISLFAKYLSQVYSLIGSVRRQSFDFECQQTHGESHFPEDNTAKVCYYRNMDDEIRSDTTQANTQPISPSSRDRQLQGIDLKSVLEKRRLDQALNAKEFAVCAGVSYSTARSWFHLPGFPVLHGVTFWQDFVKWRASQNSLAELSLQGHSRIGSEDSALTLSDLPSRALQILTNSFRD